MYPKFARTLDAVTAFVRTLDHDTDVGIYTFSRNMHRSVPLTRDLTDLRGLIEMPAFGGETALYNAVLLTVRDAAKLDGTKQVVVFSNGGDNFSLIAPRDVVRVAQEEGVPISILYSETTTVCANLFDRMARMTGGTARLVKTPAEQAEAFAFVGKRLRDSYTLTYYSHGNSNCGFRRIAVELAGRFSHGYVVQARPGYRPHMSCRSDSRKVEPPSLEEPVGEP
jgi:hypothetical protein